MRPYPSRIRPNAVRPALVYFQSTFNPRRPYESRIHLRARSLLGQIRYCARSTGRIRNRNSRTYILVELLTTSVHAATRESKTEKLLFLKLVIGSLTCDLSFVLSKRSLFRHSDDILVALCISNVIPTVGSA